MHSQVLEEVDELDELVELELELELELDVHGSHEAGEAATEPAMAATMMAAENFILVVDWVWWEVFD